MLSERNFTSPRSVVSLSYVRYEDRTKLEVIEGRILSITTGDLLEYPSNFYDVLGDDFGSDLFP